MVNVESVSIEGPFLRIGGWAVGATRLMRVEASAREILIGGGRVGIPRADVAAAFNANLYAENSGFDLIFDAACFRDAGAFITVRAYFEDGSAREVQAQLQASPPDADRDVPIHMGIDEAEITTSGRLTVLGWAVGQLPVQRVEVRATGNLVGSAVLGLERQDVAEAFRAIRHAGQSGFVFRGYLGTNCSDRVPLAVIVFDSEGRSRSTAVDVIPIEDFRSKEPAHAIHDDLTQTHLVVDSPRVSGGVFEAELEDRLLITGWAVAPQGISGIDVFLDEVSLGSAYIGIRREDVARTFPKFKNSLMAGFGLAAPTDRVSEGSHRLRIVLRVAGGRTYEMDCELRKSAPPPLTSLLDQGRTTAAEVQLKAEALGHQAPEFLVLVTVDGGDLEGLHETVDSLACQVWGTYSVCVFSKNAKQKGFARRAVRSLLARPFSGARCKALSFGDINEDSFSPGNTYLLRLPCGTRLAENALLEFAVASSMQASPDLIYADEIRQTPKGAIARRKPGWSGELLLSRNFLGEAWIASLAAARSSGLSVSELASSHPYDAALRIAENSPTVAHIPVALCSYPRPELGDLEQERHYITAALRRRGILGKVTAGRTPNSHQVTYSVSGDPLVSIVIPTAGVRNLVKLAVSTVRAKTRGVRYEIICIDNTCGKRPTLSKWLTQHCDKVIRISAPFNWSSFNNKAAHRAEGDFFLFLNDDIEVLEPDWLKTLVGILQQSGVGVVGPRLLYPDGKIQHAGLVLMPNGARHAFRFLNADDPGYLQLALTQRDVAGVTGACLAVSRDVFSLVKGFNEKHAVINNDVDFCLRVRAHGLRVVYTPHAWLIHHELASRAKLRDEFDRIEFKNTWRTVLSAGDPFLHPRSSVTTDDCIPDSEPAQAFFPTHPIMVAEKVERILAVKVDHIGDFVASVPAFRELRRCFPAAKVTALVGSGSVALARAEPSIDEVLCFDVFNRRSAEGKLYRAAGELAEFCKSLAARRFDLGIDLRKRPDARELLRGSGARVLAAYDHWGQCPWLDVALEWEGDLPLVRKRTHISEDLAMLVERVHLSCRSNESYLDPIGTLDWPIVLRRLLAAKGGRRLVTIHPGAGQEVKQWPAEGYARLADMLIESENAFIVVVGTASEAALANGIVMAINGRAYARSVAGRTSIGDVRRLLQESDLFIGNNSGPQHIASAMGVPTLGIHSGVTDANEWGPMGPRAIAVQRRMSCGPCYITTPDACPREMACLRELLPKDIFYWCRFLLRTSRMKREGR